jgi:hypothetical protein
MIQIIKLWWITASTLKHREPLPQGMVQCFSADGLWRNDRYLMINELLREGMLFKYLLVTPSFGPVKFQNNRISALHTDLVNTILVTI